MDSHQELAGSPTSDVMSLVYHRLRWITARGTAGVLAGVLVLGLGGRLVMLISRLIHPEAIGRFTENGNRIGEFTVGGTIGLIIFGGLFGGLAGGTIWVVARQWAPSSAVLVGLGAVAIGGFQLVNPDNIDFLILGDPRIDIALLLALMFVFGLVVPPIDEWLEERLPDTRKVASLVVYTLAVGFGGFFAIIGLGQFTAPLCFCDNPPIWTGVFIWLATIVTIGWWIASFRGADHPPRAVTMVGSSLVSLAALAGAVHLSLGVIEIL